MVHVFHNVLNIGKVPVVWGDGKVERSVQPRDFVLYTVFLGLKTPSGTWNVPGRKKDEGRDSASNVPLCFILPAKTPCGMVV
jgi:hypothetical protein